MGSELAWSHDVITFTMDPCYTMWEQFTGQGVDILISCCGWQRSRS